MYLHLYLSLFIWHSYPTLSAAINCILSRSRVSTQSGIVFSLTLSLLGNHHRLQDTSIKDTVDFISSLLIKFMHYFSLTSILVFYQSVMRVTIIIDFLHLYTSNNITNIPTDVTQFPFLLPVSSYNLGHYLHQILEAFFFFFFFGITRSEKTSVMTTPTRPVGLADLPPK